MEIKIFYNEEEVKPAMVLFPSKLNILMDDVRDGLPNLVNNVEHISFLKEYMKYGK